jgi:Uma2 family endonuclease
VTPSPTHGHQRLLVRLLDAFLDALREREDMEVLVSPADLVLGTRTLVQPDLFVIRTDPSRPVAGWNDVGVPVLAAEILSPGTASRDRGIKRRIYQQAGVAEYWVVDPDVRLIERWTPQAIRPEIMNTLAIWAPAGTPLLSLDLATLFE